MLPEEMTILDDPVTPAPVFAYRALRGLIFSSPDPNTSPEKPQYNNKENSSPAHLGKIDEGVEKGSYTPKQSPRKRKRVGDVVPLSPTKGLVIPVSPSKGILRTPGIATPRAKSLRDVNVKFKSLSPEVKRKEIGQNIVLEDVKVSKKEERVDVKTVKKQRSASEGAVKEKSEVLSQQEPSAAPQPAVVSAADFEAYMRRTEKEVKRLVKYGQKMREFARSVDGENTRLRELLDQAQTENERLERKLRLAERRATSSDVPNPANTILSQPATQLDDIRHVKKAKTAAATASAAAPPPPRSVFSTLTPNLPTMQQPSTSALQPYTLTTRPSEPTPSLNKAVSQITATLTSRAATAKTPAVPSPLTNLQQRLEPTPSPHTSARTNLPSEKYQAARQRIRQRQQARKTSAVSQVGGEESNIDWAGLG